MGVGKTVVESLVESWSWTTWTEGGKAVDGEDARHDAEAWKCTCTRVCGKAACKASSAAARKAEAASRPPHMLPCCEGVASWWTATVMVSKCASSDMLLGRVACMRRVSRPC